MDSSNQTEEKKYDSIRMLVVIKACLYLLHFIFTTIVSILIIKTVRQSSRMKKEVRYFLLCHHLLCCSFFCGFGMISNIMLAFKVQSFWAWIIFGVQLATGESVLITLTLMALNTCLAVCWPLRYLSFVHFVKYKVMFCVWTGIIFKHVCLIAIEYSENKPLYQAEPTCPMILGGHFAQISGILLISLLAVTIIIAYFLLYKEGKLTGHFNSSNTKARKTIIIHALQISLHILPPLIITAIGRDKHTKVAFGAFVVFLFAQSFSPVVYGLRNKELQGKICVRQKRSQHNNESVNNNAQHLQMTESSANGQADSRCATFLHTSLET